MRQGGEGSVLWKVQDVEFGYPVSHHVQEKERGEQWRIGLGDEAQSG